MAQGPSLNDPEIEATLAEIEAARKNLRSSVRALGAAIAPFDWRNWVAKHPFQSAAGAAAVGFMLAQPGGGRHQGLRGSFLSDLIRGSLSSLAPQLLRLFL